MYLDASALVKRYLDERGSRDTIALTAESEMVATAIVSRAEVAAGLARAARAGLIAPDRAQRAQRSFARDWSDLVRVPVTEALMEHAETLAWEHGLRGYDAVTRIANAPAFIKGVVNLRGIIVPIIDMRVKLNLGDPSYDQFTVVIVLNIGGRVVGMVVDSVSDVITLAPEQIKDAPQMGSLLDTDYLIGLGTVNERMLILVDIDRLMSSEEMGLIDKAAA